MGSYCSCAHTLKYGDDVILPKNYKNNKIIVSIPLANEKQQKKNDKIKRFKTYNGSPKSKKSEKKR